MGKLFSKKRVADEQVFITKQLEDELARLTDNLTQKTKNDIRLQYMERVAQNKTKTAPLSKKDAEKILTDLIKYAIIRRKSLPSNIEQSISNGEIYNHYYNRLVFVNELIDEAYIKMRRMQKLKERYEYKKKIYNNVTGHMYLEHALEFADEEKASRHKDIGEEMDEERANTENAIH